MKKVKLCHRTMSADNYEPTKCVGEGCSMYGDVGGLHGCLEANACLLQCLDCMNRINETRKPEPKKEEVETDESKADSRAGNLLEGGTSTPVQHDSDSSSSTE